MRPETGAIPSPGDYRDKYVAGLVPSVEAELPRSFETPMVGSVMDQKKVPSCVSQAWALTMKGWWYRKHGEVVDFSPRFLDTLVKRYDGTNRAIDGTYPRMVCKLSAEFGCATIKTVKDDPTLSTLDYRDDAVLTEEAFAEARKYRVPGYIRVAAEKGAIRTAAYVQGMVSVLVHVGREWWTPSWDSKNTDPVRTPAFAESGHEVVIRGWKDAEFDTLTNSWGKGWASLGHSRISLGAYKPWTIEAWTIGYVPQDVRSFIATMPSPKDFYHRFEKNMRMGEESEEVKYLQIAYMMLGYLDPVPPDHLGYFGPRTRVANVAFQRAHGIYPTAANDAGPKTRAELNQIFWK